MKATIIIRPWNEGDIKLPEYEISMEGTPDEIVEPFNSLIDKACTHPITYSSGSKNISSE